MNRLTVKQKELLRKQTDEEWIKEFGFNRVYVYINDKGNWCYRYKDDISGNLYLTLTCRALFDKGYIVPDWDCYDTDALCHQIDKNCTLGGVKAVPCTFVRNPIKALIKEW